MPDKKHVLKIAHLDGRDNILDMSLERDLTRQKMRPISRSCQSRRDDLEALRGQKRRNIMPDPAVTIQTMNQHDR